MSSPIIHNRAGRTLNERLQSLELQVFSLREKLVAKERGDNSSTAVGTQNIEEYNTMQLVEEAEKIKKLKAELMEYFGVEMAKVDHHLFERLRSEMAELMEEKMEEFKEMAKIELMEEVKIEVKEEVFRELRQKFSSLFSSKVTTGTQTTEDDMQAMIDGINNSSDGSDEESVSLLKKYKYDL